MKQFHDFDPYDLMLELQARVDRLEHAHNKMAHAFQQTEREFSELVKHFNNLQKSHLALSQLVSATAIKNWDIRPDELAPKK